MARTIWASNKNGNSASAHLCKTDGNRVRVEVYTSEGIAVLLTTVDSCIVQALKPLSTEKGDVGVWLSDFMTHVWVGRVTIDGGTPNVEIRQTGLEIQED